MTQNTRGTSKSRSSSGTIRLQCRAHPGHTRGRPVPRRTLERYIRIEWVDGPADVAPW